MDNKHNSLNLAAEICSDICPWTLSVPRSSQFSSSFALEKLFVTDNVRGQTSEHIFAPNEGYCLFVSTFHVSIWSTSSPWWRLSFFSCFCRFWVNATKGTYGYVLASLNGNTVNFALSLNTTDPDTVAKFIYLNNEVCRTLTTNIFYFLRNITRCSLSC